jgi:hypothetical protein
MGIDQNNPAVKSPNLSVDMGYNPSIRFSSHSPPPYGLVVSRQGLTFGCALERANM